MLKNTVKSTVYLLYLQYILLCMFLQYIGLKNCKILQCTVKFYRHLLYLYNTMFLYSVFIVKFTIFFTVYTFFLNFTSI